MTQHLLNLLRFPNVRFHCASEFSHSSTRINAKLLGPCFKTGRIESFCRGPHPKGSLTIGLCKIHKPTATPTQLVLNTQTEVCWTDTAPHWYNTLPPWRFQVLFTLFSKCFPSFPHGTCSLSVSHQYLDLDEVYHLLEQRSQATRLGWNCVVREIPVNAGRDSHPPRYTIPCDLHSLNTQHNSDYNSPKGFSSRSHPASLAATEGILVSFFSSA